MRQGPHKDAMNQLKVNLQQSILTLAAHGWPCRRIGRELGVHRETIGKCLRETDSKPATSTFDPPTQVVVDRVFVSRGKCLSRPVSTRSLGLPESFTISANRLEHVGTEPRTPFALTL